MFDVHDDLDDDEDRTDRNEGQNLGHRSSVDEEHGKAVTENDETEESEDPASLLHESVLESMLDALVVQSTEVSDQQVNDSDVDGQLKQESDMEQFSDSGSIGQDTLEDAGKVVHSEQHAPAVLDLQQVSTIFMIGTDEVHSETFSEEEQSEDECPNTAKEQDGGDGTPIFVFRDLEPIGTKDDERDSVSHISDHQSEEHRKEDRDQDGRVNLLILGHRHQFGGVLELLHDFSVVEFSRSIFESVLGLFDLLHGPSAGLLDLDVCSRDLGLDLRFHGLDLGSGHPCIDDECVLAVRDPYGDLSLLDLDGKFLLGSFEEGLVFLKKRLNLFLDILELGCGGGEVTVGLRKCAGRGPGLLRDRYLGESVLGEDSKDCILVLHLCENGDHVALLLVEGGEDLTVDARKGGSGILGNGSDDSEDTPVTGVQLEVDGYVGKKLKILLRSV